MKKMHLNLYVILSWIVLSCVSCGSGSSGPNFDPNISADPVITRINVADAQALFLSGNFDPTLKKLTNDGRVEDVIQWTASSGLASNPFLVSNIKKSPDGSVYVFLSYGAILPSAAGSSGDGCFLIRLSGTSVRCLMDIDETSLLKDGIFDSDGNYYYALITPRAIRKITPTGTRTDFPLSITSMPSDIVITDLIGVDLHGVLHILCQIRGTLSRSYMISLTSTGVQTTIESEPTGSLFAGSAILSLNPHEDVFGFQRSDISMSGMIRTRWMSRRLVDNAFTSNADLEVSSTSLASFTPQDTAAQENSFYIYERISSDNPSRSISKAILSIGPSRLEMAVKDLRLVNIDDYESFNSTSQMNVEVYHHGDFLYYGLFPEHSTCPEFIFLSLSLCQDDLFTLNRFNLRTPGVPVEVYNGSADHISPRHFQVASNGDIFMAGKDVAAGTYVIDFVDGATLQKTRRVQGQERIRQMIVLR